MPINPLRSRQTAKFLLKFLLFSLIFLLEMFLKSSVMIILATLVLMVLLLVLLTSPLWILLSICWLPAALITFFLFRFTQAGDKVVHASERVFYFMLYKQQWLKKPVWRHIYNIFSW